MRTSTLALAAVLATAALSVNAQPRTEPATGPFTYEAVGATPSLTFARKVAPAPKPAPAAKNAAAPRASAGAFTYEALGATPHVEAKRQPPSELVTRQPTR